jgi:histidinol-phosphate aminotransferase
MYGVLANLNAVENREVLTEDFQPEIEKIMEAVDTNTKMILCSPNNPTGNSFQMRV